MLGLLEGGYFDIFASAYYMVFHAEEFSSYDENGEALGLGLSFVAIALIAASRLGYIAYALALIKDR